MQLISIIVPCKEIDAYTLECIEKCKELDYGNIEVIVLPDWETDVKIDGVTIVPTGSLTPGAKRNIGLKYAKGSFIAYIDSDAYPRRDWLRNAIKYFDDPAVAAVSGPGLTPPGDDDLQRASGYVFSSILMGGLRGRFTAGRVREVDDAHSCNFIVRREVMDKVKWNEEYWPGEDTLLCLEIRKLGMKIIEAPDVIIYHHRKPLFIPHLKQVSRFGFHRGFFAKKFPENSRKLTYFMPSLLVLYLAASSITSLLMPAIRPLYVSTVLAYIVASLVGSLHAEKPKLIVLTWLGIILTHIVYGLSFIAGLLSRDLRR